MTQIDSRIALGFQPQTQIQDPTNALAKMLQVQGMQQESQMRGLQMQDAADARVSKNKLAELYRTSIGADGKVDRNRLFQGAAQQGLGAQIPGLQKEFAAADEQTGKNDAAAFKLANERYNAYRQTLGSLAQRPDLSKDMVLQAGQELVNAGVLPMEMYQKAIAAMPDDPNQIRMKLREGVAAQLTPEQQFTVFAPKPEKIDNGQTIGFRDTNPNSPTYGQATGGAAVQRQMTPGEVASNRVAQGNLEVAQGNQRISRERLDFEKSKPTGPDGRPTKPMPATALKLQNEALDMIGIASSIQADLGTIEQQLAKGTLDFGPVKNFANNAKNMVGMSDEESRNFSTFKSSMEKLRNDSLRLNKGVQTDGDAQRAWNELFQNINDKELVKQRLGEIKAINARAVDLRKREVEDIRNNYNQQQYDFSTQTNVPSAITPPSGGGMPTADAIEAELKRRAAARGGK